MTEAILGVLCLALLCFQAWREKKWEAEREMLIQRLQSPETSVAAYHVQRGKRQPIPTLPYDDDRAFKAAKEKRELNGDSN